VSTESKHPRRRTAREWARLVAAWQKSGKTADEFAGARGIAPRTLVWWRWRLASKPESSLPSPAPVRLVPVQVVAESSPTSLTAPQSPEVIPAWEIVTARGHVLRVHRGIADAELAMVLAALDLAGGQR
jgi:transposase